MDRNELAGSLLGVAKELTGSEDCGSEQSRESVLFGLREAQEIVASVTGRKLKRAASPRTVINGLPGLSPMQVKQQVDKIVEVRQALEVLRRQYEAELKKLSGLEAEEKAGIAVLKKAAQQMKDKGRFLIEAEDGLLEFTAYVQDKAPGVAQMIGDPEASKLGEKAGEFFERVGVRLGKKMQDAVADIYVQTKEDLTHAADVIRGLKVVSKTASVNEGALKKAGIADTVVAVKEWLAGMKNALAARVLNFVGDVKRWVKGFDERTKMVRKDVSSLDKAMNEARGAIDSALA